MAVRQMLVAGRYRLLEPVGAGGMGRVWLARDEMLHREVAVKEIVPPDWMTGAEKDRLRSRTLREARSAARLNHPHVVRIYDVVHAEGLSWIVMEYVQSRSLQQVLHEEGPYEPAVAARIGLAVLDALAAAHRAGVLHRDVKPHNVLIGTDGRVVLTDFGLATFVDDGSVTAPGLIVGSPQYVSPERARDGASTVESDLWSLGATLYAAVEGRSPYARETAMATLAALATEPPDPPVRAGPLASVLDGLLRYEPATRLTVPEVERRLRMIVFEDPREKIPFLPGQRDGRRARGTTGPGPVPEAEPGSPHAAGSPARPHRGTAPVAGRSSPHASPAAAAPEAGTHIGRPRSSPDPVRRATGAAPVPPSDGAPSPGSPTAVPRATGGPSAGRPGPSASYQAGPVPNPSAGRGHPPSSAEDVRGVPSTPGTGTHQGDAPGPAAATPAGPNAGLPGIGPSTEGPADVAAASGGRPDLIVGNPSGSPGRAPVPSDPSRSRGETPSVPAQASSSHSEASPAPGQVSSPAMAREPDPSGPPPGLDPPAAAAGRPGTTAHDPEAGRDDVSASGMAGTKLELWQSTAASGAPAAGTCFPDGRPAGDQAGRQATDPLPSDPAKPKTSRLPPAAGTAVVRAASGGTTSGPSNPHPTRSVRVTQARIAVTALVMLALGGSLFAGYVADRDEPRPQVFLPSPSAVTESLVTTTPSPTVPVPPAGAPASRTSPASQASGTSASRSSPASQVSPAEPAGSPALSKPATTAPSTAVSSPQRGTFVSARCDTSPPTGLPATPRKGATRGVNGWTLPPGWSYFTDGSGFHIAIPDDWTYQRIGTTYCFRNSRNSRVLSLDAGQDPVADPVRALQAEEGRLAGPGGLPGYTRVGLEAVALLHRAADWEYRYRTRGGAARHTIVRWFVVDGRAFVLSWTTAEKTWTTDLGKLQMVRGTFYAVGATRNPAPSPS
ncbi:serine/threonine-protein kinase [Actinoplanes hulinensis]|uniref:serine/threonine-protein kinase n=1 Tax=Actinoplanes hulinensis TaxID=1144547 RepID=UPI001FE2B9DC|nr:serine/threonine-protein kinase [Actinoplanes hulinensis]